MRCDFCGYEFKEEEAYKGCKNCPFTQGCPMLKCPRCNYEIPKEPSWIKKWKFFLQKRRLT